MKVIQQLKDHVKCRSITAIALGTFDGVHIGHRRIIHRAVELAQAHNGNSMVFTSKNHPLSQLRPRDCPKLITTSEQKSRLIESIGIDCLCMIPFTQELLALQPLEFIALLHEYFRPRYIVVGSNYTFGYKAAGTVETLQITAKQYDFQVEIPNNAYREDKMVSSTAIRGLITKGNVVDATRMLGRPFALCGVIKACAYSEAEFGENRIVIKLADGAAVPCSGIYSVIIKVNNIQLSQNVWIGTATRWNARETMIEVHLLNNSPFLKCYELGKKIELHFMGNKLNGEYPIWHESREGIPTQLFSAM